MREIITIIGNSLSMMRPHEGCHFIDTYPYKLDEALEKRFYIVNNSKRANTVEKQLSSMAEDAIKESKYIIVQFGIVECFPRIFTNRERFIISKLPAIFSKPMISFTSKRSYFFTKLFKKVYVPKTVFKEKYISLVEYLYEKTNAEKVFFINISATNDYATERRFNVWNNIEEYNKIIVEIANLYGEKSEVIDVFKITKERPDYLLKDGVHLNGLCHGIIANMISSKIKSFDSISF